MAVVFTIPPHLFCPKFLQFNLVLFAVNEVYNRYGCSKIKGYFLFGMHHFG
jgi:hypothetical protein